MANISGNNTPIGMRGQTMTRALAGGLFAPSTRDIVPTGATGATTAPIHRLVIALASRQKTEAGPS